MTERDRLYLYEEVLLLALRDRKGTLATSFANMAIAGALVAELVLQARIGLDGTRRNLVDVRSREPLGDPILDEALERIAASKRRAALKSWVMRLANLKRLHHRAAQQLCRRGILRADEDTVLLFFRRKVYPELNPLPERQILERMRSAIVGGAGTVAPRTVVLISLAKGADLLKRTLGRDVVNARKERIKEIVRGEATGKATQEAIEAAQAAVVAAAVLPAVIASSSHH
jgi:hypothetical protein